MTGLVDDDGLVLAESGPWAVCIGDGPRFVVGVDCVIFETRAEADRHAARFGDRARVLYKPRPALSFKVRIEP